LDFLVVNCHPECAFQLAAETILLVSLGVLATITLPLGCIIGVINMNISIDIAHSGLIATIKVTKDMWSLNQSKDLLKLNLIIK
jgi:hypothetical protein